MKEEGKKEYQHITDGYVTAFRLIFPRFIAEYKHTRNNKIEFSITSIPLSSISF